MDDGSRRGRGAASPPLGYVGTSPCAEAHRDRHGGRGGWVYVTQWAAHRDYTDACRFGPLRPIAEPGDETHSDQPDLTALYELVSERVELFDPNRDYVLLSGDPAIISAVMFVLGRKFQKVRLLKWDGQSRHYYELEFEVCQ